MPGGRGSFSFHFFSFLLFVAQSFEFCEFVVRWSELETTNERINLEGEMCAMFLAFLGKQGEYFYAVTKLTSSLQSQTSTYFFGAAAVYRKLFFIHHFFGIEKKIEKRVPFHLFISDFSSYK